MKDTRKKEQHGFFGFFECVNNPEIFEELWGNVLKISNTLKIKKLEGPINGASWYPYRVIKNSDGTKHFFGEPIVESYYYNLLANAHLNREIEYFSILWKNDVIKF